MICRRISDGMVGMLRFRIPIAVGNGLWLFRWQADKLPSALACPKYTQLSEVAIDGADGG